MFFQSLFSGSINIQPLDCTSCRTDGGNTMSAWTQYFHSIHKYFLTSLKILKGPFKQKIKNMIKAFTTQCLCITKNRELCTHHRERLYTRCHSRLGTCHYACPYTCHSKFTYEHDGSFQMPIVQTSLKKRQPNPTYLVFYITPSSSLYTALCVNKIHMFFQQQYVHY